MGLVWFSLQLQCVALAQPLLLLQERERSICQHRQRAAMSPAYEASRARLKDCWAVSKLFSAPYEDLLMLRLEKRLQNLHKMIQALKPRSQSHPGASLESWT